MIQAVIILIFYILGPALIFIWAFKRYRAGVKPDGIEVAAVSLSVVLIALMVYNFYGSVSDEDKEDVEKLVAELTQRYTFPVQARYAEKPAVFGVAARRTLDLRVYGVIDTIEQEKIVDIVRKMRRQLDSKPMTVQFFEKEIWEQKPDGTRFPVRDKETLLHKYRVE